jgi:hypothetical protein
MSTPQKRSSAALEMCLLILFGNARDLELQLHQLKKLRYQVWEAELSARKSRRTDNGIGERLGERPRPLCSIRPEPAALADSFQRGRPAPPPEPAAKPAPAAFLESRRGRRFTAGTLYFKLGRNDSSWGFLVLSNRRIDPESQATDRSTFCPMPGGRSQAASDAPRTEAVLLDHSV